MLDLTVFIPAHNRPDYLERTLAYLSDIEMKFDILVIDSSLEKYEKIDNSSINYIHSPKMNLLTKYAQLENLIKTKYFITLAHDDFIFFDEINSGIEFLEENSDYVSYGGRTLDFIYCKKANDIKYFERGVGTVSLSSNTLSDRIKSLIKNDFSLYRTLCRREILSVYKLIENIGVEHIHSFQEAVELSILIRGKFCASKGFIYAREIASGSAGSVSLSLVEILKQTPEDFNRIEKILLSYSKEQNLNISESSIKNVIENIILNLKSKDTSLTFKQKLFYILVKIKKLHSLYLKIKKIFSIDNRLCYINNTLIIDNKYKVIENYIYKYAKNIV